MSPAYVEIENISRNEESEAVQKITLKQDMTLEDGKYVSMNGDFILDLNGYKLEGNGQQVFACAQGYTQTITDSSAEKTGRIINSSTAESGIKAAAAVLNANTTLNIEGGTLEAPYAGNGLAVFTGNGNVNISGGVLSGKYVGMYCHIDTKAAISGGTITGGNTGVAVLSNVQLNISGGSIEGTAFALAGNGTQDHTVIRISGGTLLANRTGIYHPQVGELTITGGSITAPNGVQFSGAGTLNISDDAYIHATGAYSAISSKPSEENSGTANDGAAVSVLSRGEGYQDGDQTITVNISGGTLISDNNAAVTAYRFTKVDGKWYVNGDHGVDNYLKSLSITGGEFSCGENKEILEIDSLAEEESDISISQGKFSRPPKTEYIVKGRYWDDNSL